MVHGKREKALEDGRKEIGMRMEGKKERKDERTQRRRQIYTAWVRSLLIRGSDASSLPACKFLLLYGRKHVYACFLDTWTWTLKVFTKAMWITLKVRSNFYNYTDAHTRRTRMMSKQFYLVPLLGIAALTLQLRDNGTVRGYYNTVRRTSPVELTITDYLGGLLTLGLHYYLHRGHKHDTVVGPVRQNAWAWPEPSLIDPKSVQYASTPSTYIWTFNTLPRTWNRKYTMYTLFPRGD